MECIRIGSEVEGKRPKAPPNREIDLGACVAAGEGRFVAAAPPPVRGAFCFLLLLLLFAFAFAFRFLLFGRPRCFLLFAFLGAAVLFAFGFFLSLQPPITLAWLYR